MSELTKFEIQIVRSDDIGPTQWVEQYTYGHGSGGASVWNERKDILDARQAERRAEFAESQRRGADIQASLRAAPKRKKRWWNRDV